MIHHDGVDGPEEEADEGNRDRAADERGHEPDDELERDREEDVEEDGVALADLRRDESRGLEEGGWACLTY